MRETTKHSKGISRYTTFKKHVRTLASVLDIKAHYWGWGARGQLKAVQCWLQCRGLWCPIMPYAAQARECQLVVSSLGPQEGARQRQSRLKEGVAELFPDLREQTQTSRWRVQACGFKEELSWSCSRIMHHPLGKRP